MVNRFTILGERCSGTNYLQNLLEKNFNIPYTKEFGDKHFRIFNQSNYIDSDSCLFVGIIRDAHSWVNSLYETPWHIAPKCLVSKFDFLNTEFYSCNPVIINDKQYHFTIDLETRLPISDVGNRNIHDLNMFTNKKFKNIFECRNIKTKYLIELMQFKVKNYILITYDQIKNNPSEALMCIKEMFNLNFKNSDIKTYKFYKNTKEKFRQKKYNHFEQDEIYLHPDYAHDIESKLRFL
jgi:hypothetical protein